MVAAGPKNFKSDVDTVGNIDNRQYENEKSTLNERSELNILSHSEDVISKDISKGVLRKKLSKMRHLVIPKAISAEYLDILFPQILELFEPQIVMYNGGIAKVKEWKISCYLEVMDGGIPCTNPKKDLLLLCLPLLQTCDLLFAKWYKQQHACNGRSIFSKRNNSSSNTNTIPTVKRLMTFITRYTPQPGEQALLKHVDGAGKVDGSVVVALPIDRWSAPEEVNSFVGGGLTFWDGKDRSTGQPVETHYDTRSGDIAFIDRAVWHQADPITKGTRWAIVIFYKVLSQCQDL